LTGALSNKGDVLQSKFKCAGLLVACHTHITVYTGYMPSTGCLSAIIFLYFACLLCFLF